MAPCEALGLVKLIERQLAVEVARREALERRVAELERLLKEKPCPIPS